MTQDAVSHYLKQVGAGLVCSRGEKKQLLAALREELLDAEATDYDSLVAQFGQPEAAAEALYSSENGTKQRKLQKNTIAILGIVVAALLVIGVAATILYIRSIELEPLRTIVIHADPSSRPGAPAQIASAMVFRCLGY